VAFIAQESFNDLLVAEFRVIGGEGDFDHALPWVPIKTPLELCRSSSLPSLLFRKSRNIRPLTAEGDSDESLPANF
jgi:hypothetical protein